MSDREKALEWFKKKESAVTMPGARSMYREAIKALSEPKRKTGHWVEIGDEPYDEWECDVCGFVIDGSGCIDPEEYRDIYRFCPNCGADMRGEQDG